MTIAKWIAPSLALVLPAAGWAQVNDVAYCRALAQAYERYVVKVEAGRTVQSGPLDGRIALEQCRAGDVGGIPVLERRLRDAKVELPSRG